MQKRFTVRNEAFTCKRCGKKNPQLAGSCRNHCRVCLFSKHVDGLYPGSRQEICKGLMEPVGFYQSGKKGIMIEHRCIKCRARARNKVAPDDNLDVLL